MPTPRKDLWNNVNTPFSLNVVSSTKQLLLSSFYTYKGNVNQISFESPSTGSSLTGTRRVHERYNPGVPNTWAMDWYLSVAC